MQSGGEVDVRGDEERQLAGANTLRAEKIGTSCCHQLTMETESAQDMYKHCHSEHMTKDTMPKHQR